jgi:hypothetical protein
MHRYRWVILVGAAAVLAAGCWYQRPNFQKMYNRTEIGMTIEEVAKTLKRKPTMTLENEAFYIYDDPEEPVRMRFVLNDKQVVIAKFFENKWDLAKKTEETMGEIPVTQPLPGEEKRTYPGGPIPRFEKKPGEP